MYIPAFSPAVTGTVYGVILNDHDSLLRMGAALSEAPYKAPAKAPVLYIKPGNTMSASGTTVTLPSGASAVEIGATVGIVMGASAARLHNTNAKDVIAGYVAVADLSLPHSSYYRPAIREKCFDDSCVIATDMAPATTVSALEKIEIITLINDKEVDRRALQDLVRDVPTLLVDVSEFMTLRAGDVLLTGVRWQAPTAQAGDHVEVRIAGIGNVNFTIQASAAGN